MQFSFRHWMAVFGFVVDRTLKRTCVDKLFSYARSHSSEQQVFMSGGVL